MSYQDLVLGFNKGFDRSVTPFKADIDTAYELMNLRIARAERGRLEQTPYFNDNTYAAGTYWNGSASTAEAAISSIYDGWYNRRTGTQTLFSEFTMRDSGTQIPIFYQSMLMTATSDVTKGCYIVINNVTGLAITLGSTLEIVIDGAATFKWRKNATGAYTATVPITTAGVSIDGGNATVYFLTSAGFTIADGWTWTRTDCTISPVHAATGIPGSVSYISECVYGSKLVWLAHDNRVMLYDPTLAYAISVGYQPVCGYFIKIFYDHLFVGDSTIGTSPVVYSGVLRNSDLNDINAFIPTDTNEADLHTFNEVIEGEAGAASGTVQQLFVVSNRIFLLNGLKVYASTYLGLPIVFNFEEVTTFNTFPFNNNRPRVVQTTNAAYIIRRDGIWITDGISYSKIGHAQGLADSTSTTYAAVDFIHNELVVLDVNGKLVYVYQETYKCWHRRSASFAQGAGAVFFSSSSARLTFGGGSLHYYVEDTGSTGTPVKDSAVGTAFTLPSVVSQLVSYGNFRQVKDVSGSVLLARAVVVSGMNAAYQATTNIIVKLYWGGSTDGLIVVSSTDVAAVWTTATADSELSFPRFSARAPAFRLDVTTVDTTKPPAGVSIIQYQPHITVPAMVPTR